MTHFESNPKVGDWIKVTINQTHQGEVKKYDPGLNLIHLDSGDGQFVIDLDFDCCFDSDDVTVERIDPPLREGWWEVWDPTYMRVRVLWFNEETECWSDEAGGSPTYPPRTFQANFFLGKGSRE